MQIGVVAEATGLSLRTIRYYEQVDLVVPSARTDGGFRVYSDDDVERLRLVRQMKPLGFSLEEMRQLLTTRDVLASEPPEPEREVVLDRLATFQEAALARVATARERLTQAERFAHDLSTELDEHRAGET